MRRKDREITDCEKIDQIITSCFCCRLGFCDDSKAYIVPLNFGYEKVGKKRIFYFHSAMEGRKIDLIQKTHYASFEMDTKSELHSADTACGYSASFQSVMGAGRVDFVEELGAKKAALCRFMQHYT